jgi:hypothetical protein
MHLLEASFRAQARFNSVYLSTYLKKSNYKDAASKRSVFVSCEKDRHVCSFFIRFEPYGAVEGWLRCTEIKTVHSCERVTNEALGGKLKKRMDAFVSWR